MVSFFLILESLNEIWGHLSEFWKWVKFAQKKSIYSFFFQKNADVSIFVEIQG